MGNFPFPKFVQNYGIFQLLKTKRLHLIHQKDSTYLFPNNIMFYQSTKLIEMHEISGEKTHVVENQGTNIWN